MEIRTGRGIAWVFAIGGIGGVIAIITQLPREALYFVAPFFALGALVGIKLLARPQLVLRIHEEQLELYTGALSHNRCQGSIPIRAIENYKVHLVGDGEGTSWYLTLHLKEDRKLTDSGERWMRSFAKSTSLDLDDRQAIHWLLTWPQGGGKRVKAVLDQHLKPAIRS